MSPSHNRQLERERQVPLVCSVPAAWNFDVTPRHFPEVAELLRQVKADRTVAAWAGFFEYVPDADSENFLVVSDRLLAMDDVEHLPAEVMAHSEHPKGRFQLADVSLEFSNCLGFDTTELLLLLRGQLCNPRSLGLLGHIEKLRSCFKGGAFKLLEQGRAGRGCFSFFRCLGHGHADVLLADGLYTRKEISGILRSIAPHNSTGTSRRSGLRGAGGGSLLWICAKL